MADLEREHIIGFVDKRRTQTTAGATPAIANFGSVADLRTALAATNAGYFTSVRLNQMTKNDMVYALRVSTGDVAGV